MAHTLGVGDGGEAGSFCVVVVVRYEQSLEFNPSRLIKQALEPHNAWPT